MLSEEIKNVHVALGALLPRVDVDSADVVRACRRTLDAAADMAAQLENNLTMDAGHAGATQGAVCNG